MCAARGYSRLLLTLYFAGVAALLAITLSLSRGHFSYSLDDPYIHLALAQQILHGHYGLNAGEPSAPSSSILWPYLLAPFSRTPVAAWIPFVYNLICGAVTCVIIGRIADRWQPGRTPDVSRVSRWLVAFLLIVVGNLYGLTFVGMEHMLQITLVSACAYGLLAAYQGEPIPFWVLLCAALAPLVRYEDLAFTLPVVLVCWLQGRRQAAIWTGLATLLPLLAFSFFLHSLGLFWLPSSVLVKGGAADSHMSLLQAVGHQMRVMQSIYLSPSSHSGMLITLMELSLILLMWVERKNPMRMKVLAAAVLGIGLMMTFGPFGWFYRYEVCVRLFAALILMSLLYGRKQIPMWALAAGLAVVGFPYMQALIETPAACTEIYRQQYQMHRFVDDYYHGNTAVNDLGWVSFNHGDQRYILDLVGLASQEAAEQGKQKTPAWLADIAHRHRVGLVMIYSKWFPQTPSSWTLIGVLNQRTGRLHGLLGSDQVRLYATPDSDLPAMRKLVQEFARTLPQKTWMTIPAGAQSG
jgi:hypothetical protein